jgi:hypothetical protein
MRKLETINELAFDLVGVAFRSLNINLKLDAHRCVVMDVLSYEEQEQTIALLQLLAHGRREIEEGRVVPAADVFAQIDAMDKEDAE